MDNPCSSHGLFEIVFSLYYDRINNIYITLDLKFNALYAPIYVVLVSKVVLQYKSRIRFLLRYYRKPLLQPNHHKALSARVISFLKLFHIAQKLAENALPQVK